MHKLVLKTFAFLKNVIYFIKVVAIFFLLVHLLYWIQNLTNGHFGWLAPFTPFLAFITDVGKTVSDGAIDAFGALFEYKYFIAVCIYVGIFYFCNFLIMTLEKLEDKCDDAHRFIKKTQELKLIATNAFLFLESNMILHQNLEATLLYRYKLSIHPGFV